jgi:hypothetical protein
MENDPRPAPYRLVKFECLRDGFARALVAGPGIRAGVWYPVASSKAAAVLLENLNLTYSHAKELTRTRESMRRPKRSAKAAQAQTAV